MCVCVFFFCLCMVVDGCEFVWVCLYVYLCVCLVLKGLIVFGGI